MDQQFDTAPTNSMTAAPVAPRPSKKSWVKPLIVIIVLAVILGAAYLVYTRMSVEVAAVVNGTKITEAALSENVEMMKKSAEFQGIDTTNPDVLATIRSQALANLINNELLIGAARRAGVSTNEAAVQTAYESILAEVGGEEELATRMETIGLTRDTLLGNIGDRLMVDAYIETETDIENIQISDAEITEYFESMSTDGVALPPLEEVRPQIEAAVLAEKQQVIVDGLIEKLRGEGEIEIK